MLKRVEKRIRTAPRLRKSVTQRPTFRDISVRSRPAVVCFASGRASPPTPITFAFALRSLLRQGAEKSEGGSFKRVNHVRGLRTLARTENRNRHFQGQRRS
jgi:hypothetical protein